MSDDELDWLAHDLSLVPESARRRELLARANVLVQNPQLMAAMVQPRFGQFFMRIVIQLLQETEQAVPSSKEMAAYADEAVTAGLDLAEARKMTAKLLGKKMSAVERAHIRFGNYKGRPGRRQKNPDK